MSVLFLLPSILGMIAVEIEFRIGGVDPEDFDDLGPAIAQYLEIPTDNLEFADYEEAFPTYEPTEGPTELPTEEPTGGPTEVPTRGPTNSPTDIITQGPTTTPTQTPTQGPTQTPTQTPSEVPSSDPRRLMHVRRRLSLDDLYTLVFVVYVEDEAAAEALIASVQEKQDQEGALAQFIADELDMDPADIIANPTVVEYQDGSASSLGNINGVAGWVIAIAIVIAVIAGVFIISYGQDYQPSDVFWFEESMKKSESTGKQVR